MPLEHSQLDAREIASSPACTQCGLKASDLEPDAVPEVMVLEENFGEPYLWGVRCRICDRVAKGVGRPVALKAWADGAHDLDIDEFGQEYDNET